MKATLAIVMTLMITITITILSLREKARERAEQIFRVLDVNGDGNLDEEEFCKLDDDDDHDDDVFGENYLGSE